MIDKGTQKVEKALDIINLVRSQVRLKALEDHLFSIPQKTLLRMNKINYLSDGDSTTSDENGPNFDSLLDYKIESQADIALLKTAYPKQMQEELSLTEVSELPGKHDSIAELVPVKTAPKKY